MQKLKKQREMAAQYELAVEGRLDRSQIKKLDKLYLIIACILMVGWGTWTLGGFNFLKGVMLPKFNAVADYFNQKSWDKKVKYIPPCYNTAKLCGDYIVYSDYATRKLISIKRDGGEAKGLLNNFSSYGIDEKDGWIYYYDEEKGIMKMLPDGSEKTAVINKKLSQGFEIIGNNIYYRGTNNEYYMANLDGSNSKLILRLSDVITEVHPYSNYIYYSSSQNPGIFKSRVGEKERKRVLDNKGINIRHFSVYRDHIYFSEVTGGLFMCNLDGSNKTKIDTDVDAYTIEDSTLYYAKINHQPFNNLDNSIKSTAIRSNLDGSSKRVVSTADGYMYYLRDSICFLSSYPSGDLSFKDIGRNKTISIPEPQLELLIKNLGERLKDSTPGKVFSSAMGNNNLVMDKDGSLYFSDYTGGNKMFKYKKGDEKPVKISDDNGRSLKLLGSSLFYISSRDNHLYVMDTKSLKVEKVLDFDIYDYSLRGDGIYFNASNLKFYKADFNTGKVEKLQSSGIIDFEIEGDYVYLLPPGSSKSIVKMKLDGTSREEIKLPAPPNNFTIKGDYIYFMEVTSDGGYGLLTRVRLGTQKKESLVRIFNGEYLITEKYIVSADYGSSKNGMLTICLYNLDGSNKRELEIPSRSMNYFLNDDKVYYIELPNIVREYSLNQLIKK